MSERKLIELKNKVFLEYAVCKAPAAHIIEMLKVLSDEFHGKCDEEISAWLDVVIGTRHKIRHNRREKTITIVLP